MHYIEYGLFETICLCKIKCYLICMPNFNILIGRDPSNDYTYIYSII
jgi:hypothetical protein